MRAIFRVFIAAILCSGAAARAGSGDLPWLGADWPPSAAQACALRFHAGRAAAVPYPALAFSDETLEQAILRMAGPETVVVADDFSYPRLRAISRAVLVQDCDVTQVERFRALARERPFRRVIGVGGCTALDVAKAVAEGRPLAVIPSILSTSCLSVNRSVLHEPTGPRGRVTTGPRQTLVLPRLLLEGSQETIGRWTASGLGDLFANIGAAIDVAGAADRLSRRELERLVPEAFEALAWVRDGFRAFDRPTLERIAAALHEASIGVAETGSTRLSAGGEHQFYYHWVRQHPERQSPWPSHGQLVAVGTLIAARLAGERTGDFSVYRELREGMARLGLPIDWEGLAGFQMFRPQVLRALRALQPEDGLLGEAFAGGDGEPVLDRVFGSDEP